ncbi:carboxymuconolactone decarboxylase family protein [Mesorhizobium sp. BR1-1-9]|uniref:carboxymuconolactone decarboxylase family protein n=1 Tax=unclassified Mesorhizobium TaxID=325217 RepID=UPI001CD14F9B|nr:MULTISPECIES: carboxymuconolactone decarboxylase family protein [unclassified Mesorhizobium]MBZ9873244.1 carboxymuconolactone decarboxylase family protein [Mesorhizobium sp. BR1-1-9]MBZ9944945.1 carboxymuconolactone decarboxylase family protein [Mesorhizobium sp. BR1-1-13]
MERIDFYQASPAGMKTVDNVYNHVLQSGLSKTLIDLLFLCVSLINGCAYCIDMHTADLMGDKVSTAKIALVPAWHEGGNLFDETERAALAWAETVTRVAETGVPEAAYQAAAKVFDPGQLTELTIAIGLINAYNRLAISFRKTPESLK